MCLFKIISKDKIIKNSTSISIQLSFLTQGNESVGQSHGKKFHNILLPLFLNV
jgi:hypothetical protein